MFKRFFVGFLAFAFVSVQANAVSNNSLKAAFDELSFQLSTIKPTDRAAYDAKMKDFTAKVADLQAKGLTNAELVEFSLSQIKDKNLAAELNTAFTMISLNKMGQADARKLVLDTVSKSYNQGASWSGSSLLLGGIVVLVLVAALASAGGTGNGGGNGGGACYNDYVCYDYYDAWGYYWYSDCFYDTYCY